MTDTTLTPTDNYDVLVRNENTLFLYAPIGAGDRYNYNTNAYDRVGITDGDFISAMNALEDAGETEVHIRLNSTGGSTKHGRGIIARMQSSKMKIHTYNDGTAASMAAAIWACGHQRNMATNAILMIHHPWDYCSGNAKDMRDCAAVLDKISEAMIIGFAEAFGQTVEAITALFFSDYSNKYYTYTDMKEQGFLHTEEYSSGITANKDAIAAAIRDPFAEYRAPIGEPKAATTAVTAPNGHPAHAPKEPRGILAQISALLRGATSAEPFTPSLNTLEMTKAELKAAIEEGKLTPADVQAVLTEATAAPVAATPTPDPNAQAVTDLQAALTEMRSTMTAMQTRLDQYAAAPGASRTMPAPPPDDLPTPDSPETAQSRLEKWNTQIAGAVERGEGLTIAMGE